VSVSIDGLRDLTFDEFVELPEELHQGAELFDGVVRVTSPIIKHQRAVIRILLALVTWCNEHSGHGEAIHDYLARINDRSGYKPDVAWYPADRIPGTDGPEWRGVPAIVVEVLSPSTRRVDQVRKPGGYASIGVDEVWIVDVDDRSVLLLRQPAGAGYAETVELSIEGSITSPLLPGFSLPVADVFAE
jgi:Uma2 family endonuclease